MENLVGLCPLCHNLREDKRPGVDSARVLRDQLVSLRSNPCEASPDETDSNDTDSSFNPEASTVDGDGHSFERVGTVRLRDQAGSAVIPIEEAINQSGNAGGDGIKFRPGDEHSLIGRVVDNEEVTGDPDVSIDGRKHELTRAINRFGAGGTKSVALPTPGLEHLGVDRGAAADGVALDVWMCTDPAVDRPLIAVTPEVRQTMQFDVGDFE